MTLVIDTAPLVALADATDPLREAIHAVLLAEEGPFIIPAPATAEIDHMLGRRVGAAGCRAFLADLAAGRFDVACLDHADYATVLELEDRYADLDLGLVDCAIVVTAARASTRRLLTLDERHFRSVRPLDGGSFVLLPTDRWATIQKRGWSG